MSSSLFPYFAQILLPALIIVYQPLSLWHIIQADIIYLFKCCLWRDGYSVTISISTFCSNPYPTQYLFMGDPTLPLFPSPPPSFVQIPILALTVIYQPLSLAPYPTLVFIFSFVQIPNQLNSFYWRWTVFCLHVHTLLKSQTK